MLRNLVLKDGNHARQNSPICNCPILFPTRRNAVCAVGALTFPFWEKVNNKSIVLKFKDFFRFTVHGSQAGLLLFTACREEHAWLLYIFRFGHTRWHLLLACFLAIFLHLATCNTLFTGLCLLFDCSQIYPFFPFYSRHHTVDLPITHRSTWLLSYQVKSYTHQSVSYIA